VVFLWSQPVYEAIVTCLDPSPERTVSCRHGDDNENTNTDDHSAKIKNCHLQNSCTGPLYLHPSGRYPSASSFYAGRLRLHTFWNVHCLCTFSDPHYSFSRRYLTFGIASGILLTTFGRQDCSKTCLISSGYCPGLCQMVLVSNTRKERPTTAAMAAMEAMEAQAAELTQYRTYLTIISFIHMKMRAVWTAQIQQMHSTLQTRQLHLPQLQTRTHYTSRINITTICGSQNTDVDFTIPIYAYPEHRPASRRVDRTNLCVCRAFNFYQHQQNPDTHTGTSRRRRFC
jgi:hypothetical protein